MGRLTPSKKKYPGWNKKLGTDGADIGYLKKLIKQAGNSCTYFAPSISGINRHEFSLYSFFKKRKIYFDNFYVNDWTHDMIKMLLGASRGVYIIHRDYKKIIQNFRKNYSLTNKNNIDFDGTVKENWNDNNEVIARAIQSGKQLVLFSGGPGGKIIGPKIAQAKKGQVVLDVGNTLMPWSLKRL